jgi:prolyl-tRNA editing enzyme YbaK/EbsC (Cys-tRNA(Pro) deacylase)
MQESVVDRVESLLKQLGIAFQALRHEPVYTSEEAARVRGTPLASGAKALICKGADAFVMFVVPVDRKLDISVSMRYADYAQAEKPEPSKRDSPHTAADKRHQIPQSRQVSRR